MPSMVRDERAALWESAAVDVIATAETLEGEATMIAQAVLALVKDRWELQRYAERLTTGTNGCKSSRASARVWPV